MKPENPTAPDFSFEIVSVPHGKNPSVLLLRGHLDAGAAPHLSEKLTQMLDAGVQEVHLDFADVRFISSTGIGTLIAAIGEYRDAQGDVIVCNLNDEIREVFELLDLLDYVNVR